MKTAGLTRQARIRLATVAAIGAIAAGGVGIGGGNASAAPHVNGPFPNLQLCYAAWFGIPHATGCYQGTSGLWYFVAT